MRWIAVVLLAMLGTAGHAAAQAGAVTTCVARGTELSLIQLPAGDTAAFQDSVRRAEPSPRAGYAAEQPWFTGFEPVTFVYRLTRYGQPRFIEGHMLRRVGEHRGVGVYAVNTEWWRVEALYVPTRAGCEFQPYTPPHWGIPCSVLGCPFPRADRVPDSACRLRGDDLKWERTGDPGCTEAAAPLADSRRWYAMNVGIEFRGHSFEKSGSPRELPVGSVHRIGEVDGVGVYVGESENGAGRVWGFYVPVSAGCEFQLYEDAEMFGPVRGE